MTAVYQAPLLGYRLAVVRQGDTIEGFAARETGDASAWRKIVNINALSWPYITDDIALAGNGVALSAATFLKVPSPKPAIASPVTDRSVFGTDLALVGGQLQVANGDLATITGAANLVQAVKNRLTVFLGELPYHPFYGSGLSRLIGKRGTAANNARAAAFVKSAIKTDPRIAAVTSAIATITGDHIVVEASAEAVDGKVLPTGKIYVSN